MVRGKQSFGDLNDNIQRPTTQVTRVPGNEGKQEKILEGITDTFFSDLIKNINPQIKVAQEPPSRTNTKKTI